MAEAVRERPKRKTKVKTSKRTSEISKSAEIKLSEKEDDSNDESPNTVTDNLEPEVLLDTNTDTSRDKEEDIVGNKIQDKNDDVSQKKDDIDEDLFKENVDTIINEVVARDILEDANPTENDGNQGEIESECLFSTEEKSNAEVDCEDSFQTAHSAEQTLDTVESERKHESHVQVDETVNGKSDYDVSDTRTTETHVELDTAIGVTEDSELANRETNEICDLTTLLPESNIETSRMKNITFVEADIGSEICVQEATAPSAATLYPRLDSLIEAAKRSLESKPECSVDSPASVRIRPLTNEQLQTLYYNEELVQNEAFVDDFIQHEDKKESHEFYDILMNYSRGRKNYLVAENDVKILQDKYRKLQDEVWVTTQHQINVQGQCGDGIKCSTIQNYDKVLLSSEALSSLGKTLKTIQKNIEEQLSLHAYSSQLARLQVESYLHNLFVTSPVFIPHIPHSSPVQVCYNQNSDVRHQIKKLKDCISILFTFHRRPGSDEEFIKNIRLWTERLVASLLRIASAGDHLFILNHLLRSPAGVGAWAAKFLQFPSLSVIETKGSFGCPLLDHIMTCLATLLYPAKSRDNFMSSMQAMGQLDSINKECSWILIDSDGEEDEDPNNAWLYLHENDLVALLNQIPLREVFQHIMLISCDKDDELKYSVKKTSESTMMRVFAFCIYLNDIFGCGLQTFSLSRYRQLNKRLGKLIRKTVQYVSNHWKNFYMENQNLVDAQILTRLQIEFDDFFLRAAFCILNAQNHFMDCMCFTEAWILAVMADMPYDHVTLDTMWLLVWLLHQRNMNEINVNSLPMAEECKASVKGEDYQAVMSEILQSCPVSETVYLLTALNNMAQCRPETDQEFIETVILEIMELGFIDSSTRELCSKYGRELLSTVAVVHPFVISLLLQRTNQMMVQLGMMSLYLFKELPVGLWTPTEADCSVLKHWLLNSGLTSPEHQLARHILLNLNWGMKFKTLALPKKYHRYVAVLLVEAYEKFISDKNIGEFMLSTFRQVASVVSYNMTAEQVLHKWIWEVMMKLRLHINQISQQSTGVDGEDETVPDLANDSSMMAVVKGWKNKNPAAYYVAVMATKYGHDVTDFLSTGLMLVNLLCDSYQYLPVINVLYCVVPLFHQSGHYLMENDSFIKLLQKLLLADETLMKKAKSIIVTDFPGTVTKFFTDMIQTSIRNEMEISDDKGSYVVKLWAEFILRISKWYQERNCCFLLDKIVMSSFMSQDAYNSIQELLKSYFEVFMKEDTSQGVVKSVVSWIASGINLPSFMEKASCPECSWLAYAVLDMENLFEINSKLWPTIQQQMLANPKMGVDQALKKSLIQLKMSIGPSSHRLNTYRWAQQALDTPVDHPILPILWQRFFVMYLGRLTAEASMPQRASLGERLFESSSYRSMIKKMKKQLKVTVDHYAEVLSKTTGTDGSRQEGGYVPTRAFTEKLIQLFRTYELWLDEPRLHDASLYLPGLPAQYEAERLHKVFQNEMAPWREFIDKKQIQMNLKKMSTDWEIVIYLPNQDLANKVQRVKSEPIPAKEEILQSLKSHKPPLPPPQLFPLKAPVPDISTSILTEKVALLHLLEADLSTLKQYASLFYSRIAQHVSADTSYLELLPNEYKNEWKQADLVNLLGNVLTDSKDQSYQSQVLQKTILVECYSINPLHRCSNPAAVPVRIAEKERNEIIHRKIEDNRMEYKQIMIRSVKPPPQNICTAAVHVENAITMLVKVCRASTDDSKTAQLFDISATLFYHLVGMIDEEIKFYPPTRQFFTSCVELLGQEFICRDVLQTENILKYCLENASLACYISPHLVPTNSPTRYVTMYTTLVKKSSQGNLDLIFMLLTKFDVYKWLTTCQHSKPERQDFIQALEEGILGCGSNPSGKLKMVFDIYCSHLKTLLRYQFPMHLNDILALLLKGSSCTKLHVKCWEVFLEESFSLAPDSLTQNINPELKFTKYSILPTDQIKALMQWLSSYFLQLRFSNREFSNFGLYPKLGMYIPHLSQLYANILKNFIVKVHPQFTGMAPNQVLEMVWAHTVDMFSAFLEVRVIQEQMLTPWIEGDKMIATQMVQAFKDVITFIHIHSKDYGLDGSVNVLTHLLIYYRRVLCVKGAAESVVLVLVEQFKDLPWTNFTPNVNVIQLLSEVKLNCANGSFALIMDIIPKVSWTAIIQYHSRNQHLKAFASVLHYFLLLLMQCFTVEGSMDNPELVKIFQTAESYDWRCLSAEGFRAACDCFLMSCDPKCLLTERSSSSALALRLLKSSSGFDTKTSVMWTPEISSKRQGYLHCVTQLLCQCSYKTDINLEAFGTVILNLLTEIETVESSICEKQVQQEETQDILKFVFSLLNNSNPEGNSICVVMDSICQWLLSSPHSILLIPSIKASSRCLASLSHMAKITEASIEPAFKDCKDLTGPQLVQKWDEILAALQIPELNITDYITSCTNDGAYLTLYSYLLQRLPLCQRLEDEIKWIEALMDWTASVKPSGTDESKLLLWWYKLLELLLRQLEFGTPQSTCVTLLDRFVTLLIHIGEDRSSTGILAAIGLGKKSGFSIRFRLISKALAAFLSAQVLDSAVIRLSTPDKPPAATSRRPMARQTKSSMNSIKSSKPYQCHSSEIQLVLTYVEDNNKFIGDVLPLFKLLIKFLYTDECFLKVLYE